MVPILATLADPGWGFLQWFFFALVVGLVGLASVVAAYIGTTLFRNSGFSRIPTPPSP